MNKEEIRDYYAKQYDELAEIQPDVKDIWDKETWVRSMSQVHIGTDKEIQERHEAIERYNKQKMGIWI